MLQNKEQNNTFYFSIFQCYKGYEHEQYAHSKACNTGLKLDIIPFYELEHVTWNMNEIFSKQSGTTIHHYTSV